MKLTLLGSPQSTNNLYRSHCKFKFPTVYMTKAGKELKESYQWQVKSQWKEKMILDDVELIVVLYFGTKRKTDIDNHNKLWADSLSGIVYQDDKQIQKLTITKEYDKNSPRIEIIVLHY